MRQHAYLFGGVILLVVGAFAAYLYATRQRTETQERSWIDYVLLWPLILDANKIERRGQFLTKREWLGWLAVGLLIICAIIFT